MNFDIYNVSTERRLRDEHIIDKNYRTGYPIVLHKQRINAPNRPCKIVQNKNKSISATFQNRILTHYMINIMSKHDAIRISILKLDIIPLNIRS